jgi:hypothetical protein
MVSPQNSNAVLLLGLEGLCAVSLTQGAQVCGLEGAHYHGVRVLAPVEPLLLLLQLNLALNPVVCNPVCVCARICYTSVATKTNFTCLV